MRLSDIMSGLELSTYPEIALVLFLLAFAAIVRHAFHREQHAEWERARHLPLDAAPPAPAEAARNPSPTSKATS